MLPREIATGAELRGSEYGWRVTAFPSAVIAAKRLGYACLGGQFQFRSSSSIHEMYWLCADSSPRRDAEPWSDYAVRSCEETMQRFQHLLGTTDWMREAEGWPGLAEELPSASKPADALVFVAYFVTEIEAGRLTESARASAALKSNDE